MHFTKKRFATNVLTNWAATAVNMVVPFFLTPFVVRHLGAQVYGIWILAVSAVSYFALLDLGLRSAVIRFVSRAQAQSKAGEAAAIVAGALWIRSLIAGIVVFGGCLLAIATPFIFKIPSGLTHQAQITVFLCAVGVAITLISGVFAAVLSALNRFDLLSSITGMQTIFRAAGVLILLRAGLGLVSLACWELAVLLVAGIGTTLVAWKTAAFSKTWAAKPDATTLNAIRSYSFTTFLFMIAVQIVINTDSLVIGAYLSVGMVTLYSIGSSLVNYATQVSGAVSTTFVPMASSMEATGRFEDLQLMLIRGTQVILGLVLPIGTALFFRGRTFISLWMGPQYAVISEVVLRILMISLFFSMANSTAGAIMMAIDKHKPVARWALFEAGSNLVLSIILVKRVGIYGVAWGTAISMGLAHLAFWPRYVRQVLGIPIKQYIWSGWLKILLCSLPFAAFCFLTDTLWRPRDLLSFFLEILLVIPVYICTVSAVFFKDLKATYVAWQLSRKATNAPLPSA